MDKNDCKEVVVLSKDSPLTMDELKAQFTKAKEKKRFAFVLGNGINRYALGKKAISWNDLMENLWKEFLPDDVVPKASSGLTLTEIFDIMCLKNDGEWTDTINQSRKAVAKLFSRMPTSDNLQHLLKDWQVPVLTTNYDACLEKGLKRFVLKNTGLYRQGYSPTYPFNVYFSSEAMPTDEDCYHRFAVWHINGTIRHKESLRLGTADYMGLQTYTKKFLHERANMYSIDREHKEWGIKDRARNKNDTYGFTWLNIFYNCSLCINGLGLNTDETFLRWLLISRKKYLDRIGERAEGWYICSLSDLDDGKRYFLQNVGFTIVVIEDMDTRYQELFELKHTEK